MKCTADKNCEGRASKFRRDRVTLLRQSDEIMPSGQPVVAPVSYATNVRCLVRDVRGSEAKNGDGIDATVDFVVEMRWRKDVDPTQQVKVTSGKHAGKTLNVTAVLYKPDEGKPREAHIYCKHNATPNG